MKRAVLLGVLLAVARAGLSYAGESGGGPFGMVASTAAGGGTSGGGRFALTGAVVQPDAHLLTGGLFTLHGGFIGVLAEATVGGDAVLAITLDDSGNAELTWNQPGYTLEFREALAASDGWQAVDPQPTAQTLVTPVNLPARLFRLRKP